MVCHNGTQPLRDDIQECESAGMRPNGSHFELNLQQGDSYDVTVVAYNVARRFSAAYTAPPVMETSGDGIMGPDMDFKVILT